MTKTAKTTYTGTAPDGTTFTVSSAKVYTHAVVAVSVDLGATSQTLVNLCGRLDLAVKSADTARQSPATYGNVAVVEVVAS